MCVSQTNNQPSSALAGLRLAEGNPFLTPTNIRFRYLYRDASNYKQHGEAIFTNHSHLSLMEIETRIRASLNDGEFFIARQVCLEEFFFDSLEDDDHPWHEFAFVEATTEPAFDPENRQERGHHRGIAEFLLEMEQAKQSGWDEMNVREDLKRYLKTQKEALKQAVEEGEEFSGESHEQFQP
jgi:hypothetical protein